MAGYAFTTSLKAEYAQKYKDMVLNPSRIAEFERSAARINAGKEKYLEVQNITGVPWYFIGMLHLRESDLNFHTHLHNGDSLSRRTVHVPAGRPRTGSPPFTWAFSAVDALQYQGFDKIREWGVERIAYCSEAYNGWGYRYRGYPSAYLWAGTNQYTRGKFVEDGLFSSSAIDTQLGCMGVLKVLLSKYATTPVVTPEMPPPADTQSAEESAPQNASPKADVPRPTDQQMNEVSRKHWWSDWMQWSSFSAAISTGLYKMANYFNIDSLQSTLATVEQIGRVLGITSLMLLFVAIGIYAMYQKKLMKDDVTEGRVIPSGGMPGDGGTPDVPTNP